MSLFTAMGPSKLRSNRANNDINAFNINYHCSWGRAGMSGRLIFGVLHTKMNATNTFLFSFLACSGVDCMCLNSRTVFGRSRKLADQNNILWFWCSPVAFPNGHLLLS